MLSMKVDILRRRSMDRAVKEYQDFIDNLVALRLSVEAGRMRQGHFFQIPENTAHNFTAQQAFNELLTMLTPSQRAVIADLLQNARDSGIHDTLVLLTDKHYNLVHNG